MFLSRMQPLHIGHIGMIKKALSENDKVIVLLGSSNKVGTIRNPIGTELRKKIFEEVLRDEFGQANREKLTLVELPDWTEETDRDSDLEWGRYLYYNIVRASGQMEFSMYFSDEPEIIENWFQDEKVRARINIKTYERKDMFEAVSSTKIRNAFLNGDRDYIRKSVPKAVFDRFEELKEIIDKVYTNGTE